MISRILLSFVFFFGLGFLQANVITPTDAEKVAENFYRQNAPIKKISAHLAYTETSAAGKAVYYVFNINSKDGFVIVSADDQVEPIIGYSTKNQYAIPDKRSPFSIWMSKRKAEISNIQDKGISASPEITNKWNKYINNIPGSGSLLKTNSVLSTSVTPLVQTTCDQSTYYNYS